jgi:hypothetical protein
MRPCCWARRRRRPRPGPQSDADEQAAPRTPSTSVDPIPRSPRAPGSGDRAFDEARALDLAEHGVATAVASGLPPNVDRARAGVAGRWPRRT